MAVTAATCLKACLNLQEGLASKVPANVDPTTRPIADFGVAKAMRNPQNRMGFQAEELQRKFEGKGLVDGTGANVCKTYELTYLTPDCAAAAVGVADVCVAGAFADNQACLDVTVDNYNSVKGTMTLADFDCICNNPPVGFDNYGTPQGNLAYQLRLAANKIARTQNIDLIGLMGTQVGDFFDGTLGATGKTLNLTNAAGGVNIGEMVKVNDEYRLQRMGDNFIGIGGANLATFQDRYALQEGCCTDDGLKTRGLPNLYYDLEVDTFFDVTLATSHAIMWSVGSYQVIDWVQNTGYRKYNKGNEISTTINIDGVQYDLNIYDSCGGTVTWGLGKGTDLFAIPQAAYTACNAGNGRLHYIIDCGAAAC